VGHHLSQVSRSVQRRSLMIYSFSSGQPSMTEPLMHVEFTSPSSAVGITGPEEEAVSGRSVAAISSSSSVTSWVSGSTCSWPPSSYTPPSGTCRDADTSSRVQQRQPLRRLTFMQRRELRASCTPRCPESVKRGTATRPEPSTELIKRRMVFLVATQSSTSNYRAFNRSDSHK